MHMFTPVNLRDPKGSNTVFFFSFFLFLESISMEVLRCLSTVSVCEAEIKRALKTGGTELQDVWRGSPASLDSWIPSLTMSTTENVVLEGHIGDLTRIACKRNARNIPIRTHSCESFSTCVATHKTLMVFLII